MSKNPEQLNSTPLNADEKTFPMLQASMLERRITTLRPEKDWFSNDVLQSLATWLTQQGKTPDEVKRLIEKNQSFFEIVKQNLREKILYACVIAIPVNHYGGVYIWYHHACKLSEGQNDFPEFDTVWNNFTHQHYNQPVVERPQITLSPRIFDATTVSSSQEFERFMREYCSESAIQYIGMLDFTIDD